MKFQANGDWGGFCYSILDKNYQTIQKGFQTERLDFIYIEISMVTPWWPYTMAKENNASAGYMYTFKVQICQNKAGKPTEGDMYLQKFGFRQVSWNNKQLLINNKPTYMTGINKHEDADLRGKGFDWVLISRDFNNQKWLGSNAFRTSHYPYAQEYLEQADEQGIMVIGECPGVGLQVQNFLPETYANHMQSIKEMIHRDWNHPSIVMWSLANEPQSTTQEAEEYFERLFTESRELDRTRAYTYVSGQPMDVDRALQFADFVNVNNYVGWYQNIGELDLVTEQVVTFLTSYFVKFNKPVILQEYGAGAITGFHTLPCTAWDEEYQLQVLNRTGAAFDILRKDFLIGEFIWNYADFAVWQSTDRPGGNKKGVFTRQRQPKPAAYLLRERYHSIYPDC